jgi:hypothetical protein
MVKKLFKIFRQYGIFLCIPGIVLMYSLFLKLATGPYWLAPNFDPSYQYLINGVYLIKGIVPNHTDHPGTPLQILCAVIYWVCNIGRCPQDLVTRVLTAPEFYLHIVFVVLSLFSFLTSFALAVYVFRKTNSKLAALLTQLPLLSFLILKSWETVEPVLPVVANVAPEPLLIGVLNLFNICLLMNFFARTAKDESVSTVYWGLVCGLGAAVKLTFAPLLIIPLIILPWKNKILFIGFFAASFVMWTLPILSKYHIIWGWISGIAMHQGAISYGVLAILLFAALAFAAWKFVEKKWNRGTAFLASTVVGVVVQFSAVTQHPGAHYLLPGIGLFSALLALFYLQNLDAHVLGRRMTVGVIVLAVFLGAWQANVYRLRLEGLTRGILAFHDHVTAEHPDCTVINYYRSSDPQAALFFGDGWNESPQLGGELFRLYPNKFYFNVWGNSILDFNGKVWSNDLLAQNSCVLFQGDGNVDFSRGPYEVQLLEKGRFESLHALTATTEKQAATLLAAALHFFQAGDYVKAMVCALQARKFHYQPDSSVESVIKLIEPYLPH